MFPPPQKKEKKKEKKKFVDIIEDYDNGETKISHNT